MGGMRLRLQELQEEDVQSPEDQGGDAWHHDEGTSASRRLENSLLGNTIRRHSDALIHGCCDGITHIYGLERHQLRLDPRRRRPAYEDGTRQAGADKSMHPGWRR